MRHGLLLLLGLALLLTTATAAQTATHSSVTNHPRPPSLHKAAATSPDAPVKTASKGSHLDPSNFLVVLIAAVILVYGAHRALRPPFLDMSASSAEVMAYEEAAEAGGRASHPFLLPFHLMTSFPHERTCSGEN